MGVFFGILFIGLAGTFSIAQNYRGAGTTYQAGVTYNFTVDLVPDFIFQGTQTDRFCIHEQKFTNRALWDALIANPNAVPYSISITDTETVANIPAFFPQRTFYESFSSGGAMDCGPVSGREFDSAQRSSVDYSSRPLLL